jgi:hypothetical protein
VTDTCTPVVVDGENCIQCAEVVAVAAVPSQTIIDRNLGWNASALSVAQRIGNCYVEFTVPVATLGTVVGLVGARRSNNPRDVSHGIYVYQDAGRSWCAVVESGTPMTDAVAHVAADVLRIERRGNAVHYFINGVQVYESSVRLAVPLRVIGLLFAADDGVD